MNLPETTEENDTGSREPTLIESLIPSPSTPDNKAIYDAVDEGDRENRLLVRRKIEQFDTQLQDICEQLLGDRTGEVNEINENGLREYFLSDGVYIRELFIPAQMAVVTQLWKRERFWIIAYGDVTFRSELGVQRIKGPHRQYAPYGSKIVLWTHTDTLWFAISATDDCENVEDDVIATDYSECRYPWEDTKCLGQQ